MPTSAMWRVDTVMTGPPGAPFFSRMFFNAGGLSSTDAANAVRAFWNTCASVIGTGTTINVQNVVYTVDPVTGNITAATPIATPTPVAGSASDEKMPFANQGLVTWDTGTYIAGRRLRGRTFIPTMTQAANNGGDTIAAYRSTINGAAATLVGQNLVVYSTTARAWSLATSGTTSSKIAILRSRRD